MRFRHLWLQTWCRLGSVAYIKELAMWYTAQEVDSVEFLEDR